MALAAAAVLALATVWALREANVIRWGAAGAALDRIEAVKARVAVLEQQTEQEHPADQFIVVNTDLIGMRKFCITYTTPGGVQDRCRSAAAEVTTGECAVAAAFGQPLPICYSASAADSRSTVECFLEAVIGKPLPACWR